MEEWGRRGEGGVPAGGWPGPLASSPRHRDMQRGFQYPGVGEEALASLQGFGDHHAPVLQGVDRRRGRARGARRGAMRRELLREALHPGDAEGDPAMRLVRLYR